MAMTRNDAEDIIKRHGNHAARALYLERQIQELTVLLSQEKVAMSRMATSTASAWALLEREMCTPTKESP